MTEVQSPFSHYRQVKKPNPVFIPREENVTSPFCLKLMKKAEDFTSGFDFAIYIAFLRSQGKRHRMPPALRRRAIDALLQGMCFYYDLEKNRVQRSVKELALECGLTTTSSNGTLSITKAHRALQFLDEIGLISYTPYISTNPKSSEIAFNRQLFDLLRLFPLVLVETKIALRKVKNVAEVSGDE